ncbi:hypothetical protein [Umezakia ovalisporum]|uniref:hypothetical protein n=1 Tax=Umezakia ovalisporum TaxID=75695 RepID=UPI0006EEE57D|nr:hypothetical protein [Umezakia ovalisporum]MBI1243226.1 hypothetical protein [Nostoc sp. RI_552]MDH6089146.1 DUF1672 domain-containing protein [Umezakia ovalisporum Ak1311]CEJ43562.1 Uncharacterized protein apha_00898 [Umezakia ovalisporum]
MLELTNFFLRGTQPLLVPICFVTAWTVIVLFGWSLWVAARDSVHTAKQMHQIPCANCQFFTDNYRLKCTVHPSIASTEEAIDCSDYQPKTNPMLY